MRLNNYANRHDLLIDWLLDSLPPGGAVLDIGANDGTFCPEVKRIASRASIFAGVDPDSAKLQNHAFLTQRYDGVLEEAAIPASSFDVIYAIYVLEHVERGKAFLQAAYRVLRPGGSFFFITPNGQHYFAAIAGLLARLGVQDQVLKVLRPKSLVNRYHYPALYRLNTPRTLTKLGQAIGFTHFEYRYSERLDEVSCYFPGPLKTLPRLWEVFVRFINAEKLLCNLMGRLVK